MHEKFFKGWNEFEIVNANSESGCSRDSNFGRRVGLWLDTCLHILWLSWMGNCFTFVCTILFIKYFSLIPLRKRYLFSFCWRVYTYCSDFFIRFQVQKIVILVEPRKIKCYRKFSSSFAPLFQRPFVIQKQRGSTSQFSLFRREHRDEDGVNKWRVLKKSHQKSIGIHVRRRWCRFHFGTSSILELSNANFLHLWDCSENIVLQITFLLNSSFFDVGSRLGWSSRLQRKVFFKCGSENLQNKC